MVRNCTFHCHWGGTSKGTYFVLLVCKLIAVHLCEQVLRLYISCVAPTKQANTEQQTYHG